MDNRRKTIVVNRKFQYQYSLLIAALAVLTVNAFIIYRMLFPGTEPLLFTSAEITGLAVLELILVGGIWYGGLRVSHRIAGPVFVFNRTLSALARGDLSARIHLREHDMFLDEAREMNNSLGQISARLERAKTLSQQLVQVAGTGTDTGALAQQLADELSGFSK